MSIDLDILDSDTRKNVDAWLGGDYDEETKSEIRSLLDSDLQAVTDAFYTNLTFGTGGLRGIMGVGTNRMNSYTVREATQGLVNYIKKQFPGSKELSVIIGYDSRHHSSDFAYETARVLAGNGIKAYIFSELRPVPLVSFGCRFKHCNAGVMITASHNPSEYNGYKVYWSDGGQIIPPHDSGIIAEVNDVASMGGVVVADISDPLIVKIDSEIDDAYIEINRGLQLCREQNEASGGDLRVVYTNIHGTGITLVPRILDDWGFKDVLCVEEQKVLDGDFPTVKSPNPEERSALKMGIAKLKREDADILIATDPDADRVGVVVKHEGDEVFIDGNQLGCICLYHICERMKSLDIMPEKAAFIKSIVTSELFAAIAESYDRPCVNVLCGFKFYAGKIREWEESDDGYKYIFGAEDSYGYLLGTHVRDKDGVLASALICEAALHAKLQGRTLIDMLHQLYSRYGIYREKLESLKFPPTKEGMDKMKETMASLRSVPLRDFNGIKVVAIEDYQMLTKTVLDTGEITALTLPKSNVLLFWLEDGSKLVVRPSGTEPKVKLYCGAVQKEYDDLDAGVLQCDKKCGSIIDVVKSLVV